MPAGETMKRKIAAWLLALAAGAAAATEPADLSEAALERAPVVVDGHVLVQVRGIAGRPAQERADAIAARIVAAAEDASLDVSQLKVVETPEVSRIQAGERLLMGIFDADAELEQINRQALAGVLEGVIGEAIARYRVDRAPDKIAGALKALAVATAVFLGAVVALFLLAGVVERWMTGTVKPRVLAVRIKALGLLPGEQIWASLAATGRALRFLLLLLLAYLYAQFALDQFPSTRPVARQLAGYLLDPLRTMGGQLLAELPSLMFLLVLIIIVRFALRFLKFWFAAVASGALHVAGFEPQWAEPTYRLVRIGVVAFALVVAYPYIPGSGSEAFKGLSIFAGVLISIGSSSFIANYMAGYTLIYRRLFAVGDRVQIGDVIGEVLETRVQVTRLRTYKNEEVIIPNSTILNSVVTNYSKLAASRGLILHTSVGIGYEVPWRQVEGMLLTAAERTSGVLKDPKPFVLQTGLGDFAVTYEINAFVGSTEQIAQRYDELHANIQDVFNEYGVQIMTPAYEGDPEVPKTVPREQWHAAPSRRPAKDPG
jgi:small-conductance mechanosensitive channel